MFRTSVAVLSKICLQGKYPFHIHRGSGATYLSFCIGEGEYEYKVTHNDKVTRTIAHRYFQEEKEIKVPLSSIDCEAIPHLIKAHYNPDYAKFNVHDHKLVVIGDSSPDHPSDSDVSE